jgi:hypothetical protein
LVFIRHFTQADQTSVNFSLDRRTCTLSTKEVRHAIRPLCRWLSACRSRRAEERYLQVASKAARLFKEHGALGVVECWGDDVPDGKLTSMPMAVRLKPGRPWCSRGSPPSRQVRDTA